ncbi:MAG: heme-binding domain-containing protein [Thermoanaerobaculales bacterium]|jgi:hypothetical protein|nr:heme-binding domain-containing protein [Thermoanaerobaculales bacterium]
MKRVLVVTVGLLVAALIVIQLIPVDRSNPPVVADFDGPPEVAAVLRASCYDCHSHETRWPWYSRVAPVSWLVVHDVDEGRDKMNFSRWGALDLDRRAKLAEEIWEEVEEGEMPLLAYRLAHPDARLTDGSRSLLRGWAADVRRTAR